MMTINNQFAIAVLAKQTAVKAVREDLRSRGVNPSYVSPREIRVIAKEYLASHPELLAQAAASPILREFRNDRAGNGVVRRATISRASA